MSQVVKGAEAATIIKGNKNFRPEVMHLTKLVLNFHSLCSGHIPNDSEVTLAGSQNIHRVAASNGIANFLAFLFVDR